MDVSLSRKQSQFFMSEKKYTGMIGGIGSGKSFVGSIWSMNKTQLEPETMGFIVDNTYKQLNNATLQAFFSVLDEANIPYLYKQQKGLLDVDGTKIICASLDNYDVHRGIEIGWFWIDEARDTPEDAFKMLMGRLRNKKAKKLEGRVTTSPSGFNWVYDYFDGSKKTKYFEMINASSMDNEHLPEGYIDSLSDNYDKRTYEQEVLGRFVKTSVGSIYYAFDRDSNIRECKYNPDYPLYFGMDFNINPMTAVAVQSIDDEIRVVDELWLMTSNTHEMADAIAKKYGRKHTIIPDSTGKALKTSSAGLSDHQILRDKGFRVRGHGNPFRVDRYNCVNNLLEKKRLFIDPSCEKLIRDLEQVSYKEGTSLPETKIKDLTHISDALGYYCWYHQPLLKPTTDISTSISR